MITVFRRARNILGVNARSLHYTLPYNSRTAIALANNKLASKQVLARAKIAVPRTYAVISSHEKLRRFRWTKLPNSFVLKPNSGLGGRGILVVFGRNKRGNWVRADGREVTIDLLVARTQNILDGNYSIDNAPDIAFFEQRVRLIKLFKELAWQGIPDIRVIVFNLVPVMAMLRLPTVVSRGTANLHAGGIGVGIDLASGVTTTAIMRDRIIDTLPGTRRPLHGIRLPLWEETLTIAARAQEATGVGYLGIDIALDREDGPLVLELNAQPGLSIQLANQAPLWTRLRRVEGLKVRSAAQGVKLGMSLFGEELHELPDTVGGRIVIGNVEPVIITNNKGESVRVLAKIDTGADRTSLDRTLAARLGLSAQIITKKTAKGALGSEERPLVPLSFTLRNVPIKTEATIANRSRMRYSMIVGRRDLGDFLIDPTRLPAQH
jgi:alpha-L-glutamate ligase-like protein